MFALPDYRVLQETLVNNKDGLMSLYDLTLQDIKTIFKTKGDEDIDISKEVPEYHWNFPLYMKMIFRFVQGKNCPANLIKGCDGGNKYKIAQYCKIDPRIILPVSEFFAWIGNGLSYYDVAQMIDEEHAKTWKNENSIKFFFSLDDEQKEQFVDKYNTTAI
jgi:hypothetical protein